MQPPGIDIYFNMNYVKPESEGLHFDLQFTIIKGSGSLDENIQLKTV
jgi:hypothetical protein